MLFFRFDFSNCFFVKVKFVVSCSLQVAYRSHDKKELLA